MPPCTMPKSAWQAVLPVSSFLVSGFQVSGDLLETGNGKPDTWLPRHFVLVLLKIFLAARRPAQRQLHRLPRPLAIRRILGAFVKRHDDVRAQPDLGLPWRFPD